MNSTKPTSTAPENVRGVEFTASADRAPDRREKLTLDDAGNSEVVRFDVTVSREDELWVADIAGMTAATDVLRFGDLDIEVRDLIAGLTDADPDGFEIRWHHRAGADDVTVLISDLTEVEAAAETATVRRDAVRL